MLRHRNIDRICCIALALVLLIACSYLGAGATGLIASRRTLGYENRLFDTGRVHTMDIVMEDWEGFLASCTDEEYVTCHVVIDGESYKNVAIRAKGNTSLSSVQRYGNNRYSFKIEFDHYQPGGSYHGLDKLSLNNLIQDNTYLKDYMAYTLMRKGGAAAPLCSFVQINVNGQPWGLYLAVEGVEDSFLRRNYGNDTGELYKPDSMSFGGGRGNGKGFDMDDFRQRMEQEVQTGGETSVMSNGSQPEMEAVGGATGPARMQMPGGMVPPEGFTPPENVAGMPDFGGFAPAGAEGEQPQPGETTDEAAVNAATPGRPEGNDWRPNGGFGGFGGMGSSDVRLQYSDDDPASYSSIFDNAKTDVTDADQQRLIASLKALSQGDISVVDTDAVIRYLVVHNFLCNDDSYTGMMVHNYYLYEKDGVLSMLPWDYNLAFGGFGMGGGFGKGGATNTVNQPIDNPVTGGELASRPMVSWVFDSEETVAAYHAAYSDFISEAFENGWFADELRRVTDLIAPYVESDPTAFCTYQEFQTGVETLREFCLLRSESVRGQLEGSIPATSEGQRNADSLVDASHLNLSGMGSMGGMGRGNSMAFGGDRDGSARDKGRSERPARPEPSDGDAAAAPVFMSSGWVRPENTRDNTTESWWLMGISLLVLLAALWLVSRYRSHL